MFSFRERKKGRKEKRFAIIKNSSYKTWIFNKISYQILKFVSLKALIYIVILARYIHDRSRALGWKIYSARVIKMPRSSIERENTVSVERIQIYNR